MNPVNYAFGPVKDDLLPVKNEKKTVREDLLPVFLG